MSSENMTEATESTTTEAPSTAAPETPQSTQAASEPKEGSESTTEAAPSLAPETPAYMANYKFKAMGKEHEFEDWAKGLIKDAELEAKIRKLHEKAYGLEPLKEKHQRMMEESQKKDSYYSNVDKVIAQVNHFKNTKDFDNLFGNNGLGIQFDDLVQYVSKKIDMLNLPPDQRAEVERQSQIRQQNYLLEQENQSYQAKYQQQVAQTRAMHLDSLMSRGDVASVAQAWDGKAGEVGAFRNLVIQEAQAAFYRDGIDMTPEQAVQSVVSKYGKLVVSNDTQSAQPAQPEVQTAAGEQPSAEVVAGKKEAPIIPHVAGRSTSPIRKTPSSIAELKKLAQSL